MEEAIEDPEVQAALDDLFDSMEAPTKELMRVLWPFHEETLPWLLLSRFSVLVRSYNTARHQGLIDENGNRLECDSNIALQWATSQFFDNPTVRDLMAATMKAASIEGARKHD
jgi:hypothetical protein